MPFSRRKVSSDRFSSAQGRRRDRGLDRDPLLLAASASASSILISTQRDLWIYFLLFLCLCPSLSFSPPISVSLPLSLLSEGLTCLLLRRCFPTYRTRTRTQGGKKLACHFVPSLLSSFLGEFGGGRTTSGGTFCAALFYKQSVIIRPLPRRPTHFHTSPPYIYIYIWTIVTTVTVLRNSIPYLFFLRPVNSLLFYFFVIKNLEEREISIESFRNYYYYYYSAGIIRLFYYVKHKEREREIEYTCCVTVLLFDGQPEVVQ